MKTPTTAFRIPAALKEQAMKKARSEHRTLTTVIIQLLREYVNS